MKSYLAASLPVCVTACGGPRPLPPDWQNDEGIVDSFALPPFLFWTSVHCSPWRQQTGLFFFAVLCFNDLLMYLFERSESERQRNLPSPGSLPTSLPQQAWARFKLGHTGTPCGSPVCGRDLGHHLLAPIAGSADHPRWQLNSLSFKPQYLLVSFFNDILKGGGWCFERGLRYFHYLL